MRELWYLIRTDFQRYNGFFPRGWKGAIRVLIYLLLLKNHCFVYTFWMRLASKPNLLYYPARLLTRFFGRIYGLDIPPSTKIGRGLYIGHGVGIVISPSTVIGNNCNLSQFLSIGSNHGQAAEIGDNVYIAPHVSIVEHVKIGSNVTIGAGSVVVKDIPENACVAGVPAKILNYDNPARYIGNKSDELN